ncbi:MAG: hypothetical protein EP318_10010 [Rhodobacteraceae bacterium]|nr:MAG: hypothetical protein EP318_10010 [Paracoccaceae bacterium]
MSEADYKNLVADIESQIATSGYQDRARLRRHLAVIHEKARGFGLRPDRRGARAELDRVEDMVEAQFDNLPV